MSEAISHDTAPGFDAEIDRELARKAQAGDQAALEELVRRHHAQVTNLLWKFVVRSHDLEDLVQDTFVRLVRHIGNWRDDQPFHHWLRRVAANVGRDYCRRHAVRRRYAPPAPHPDDEYHEPEAIDTALDPAARAAAEDVKELLAMLPPDDQALLTLHHLEGWDLATIAREYGWTTAATKLRAWRARRKLKALLTQKGDRFYENDED